MVLPEQLHHTDPTEEALLIDIVRERGGLTRYCQNAATQEDLYGCEVRGSSLIFRRGRHGPVIGNSHPCPNSPGNTDLHLHGTDDEESTQIHMARRPHHLTPWKTEFTVEGKNFDWYGQHELVLDGKKVAHFFPTWHILDQDEHKLGRLVVHGEGKKFVDLVVLTGLIMIDQSEEGRAAIELARKSSREKMAEKEIGLD